MQRSHGLIPLLRLLVDLAHYLEDILLPYRLILVLDVDRMVDMLYACICTLK